MNLVCINERSPYEKLSQTNGFSYKHNFKVKIIQLLGERKYLMKKIQKQRVQLGFRKVQNQKSLSR